MLGAAVRPNITMAALPQFAGAGGSCVSAPNAAPPAMRWSRLAIRTNTLDTIAGTLSRRQSAKIVLAKWLQTRPRILLLDEPTRGVRCRRQVRNPIALSASLPPRAPPSRLSLIELPEVLGLADRIIIMAEGHVHRRA